MRRIDGPTLRYVLVLTVLDRGEVVTVDDLLVAVEAMGGRLDEDAPRKQVADAIRWEIAKGRVRRAGWGRYAPGHVPRSTVRYMRRRLAERTAFGVTPSVGVAPLPSVQPWPTCSPS